MNDSGQPKSTALWTTDIKVKLLEMEDHFLNLKSFIQGLKSRRKKAHVDFRHLDSQCLRDNASMEE